MFFIVYLFCCLRRCKAAKDRNHLPLPDRVGGKAGHKLQGFDKLHALKQRK